MTAVLEEVNPSKVKSGDIMAFTYWGKVDRVETNYRTLAPNSTKLTVTDLDNDTKFIVDGDDLIKRSTSSDVYTNTEKVTKSQAVEILANAYGKPFTVTFIKKDGTLRKLRGRLIGIDQKNLGYIDVEDLDKPAGQRFRLVDCRTIKSIVVDGVKYTV
jgi:hypothetical protein